MPQKSIQTQSASGITYRRGVFDYIKIGLFEIFFVFAVVAFFFFVLNFYNIVSISNLNPNIFGWLPHIADVNSEKTPQNADITFDQESKYWNIQGTISRVSGNNIQIKSGDEIVNFEKNNNTVCSRNVNFFPDFNNTTSPSSKQIITFCSDVAPGKKISANYKIEDRKNILVDILLQ